MSSAARSVEHGGVTWKVIPGSRREQLLLRMIRQDDALHHADVEPADESTIGWGHLVWMTGVVGICTGVFIGAFLL